MRGPLYRKSQQALYPGQENRDTPIDASDRWPMVVCGTVRQESRR